MDRSNAHTIGVETSSPPGDLFRRAAALWLRQAAAFARRHATATLRDRTALFWSFLWPVLWYLFTVYLIVRPQLPTGLDPAVAGTIRTIQAVTFGTFGAITVALVGFAADLTRDLEDRRYRTFRAYPVYPTADLAGRFLGGVTIGLAAFLCVMIVGWFDGATIAPPAGWPIAIAVVAVATVALCGICATIAAAVALRTEGRSQTNLATLSIVMVAFFATGFSGTQPWLLPDALVGDPLNYVPNVLGTRLVLEVLVETDWQAAGVTPPAMPELLGGLGLLVGYLALSGVVAGAIARRLYGGDAGA